MTWTFNRNYRDLEQVEQFLPAFEARLAELTAAGQYRYNDSFVGHIPGIEGPGEDTAIYLLQHLEREKRQNEKIAALLNEGYERIEELEDGGRFPVIILYSGGRIFRGDWQEIRDGRLLPRNGQPYAVLPKGKRTNGYLVSGRDVLVKR